MAQSTVVSVGNLPAASGVTGSTRIFYAANTALWWCFTFNAADKTKIYAYSASSPDGAWTARTAFTMAAGTTIGEPFAAAYKSISSVDVVHIEFIETDPDTEWHLRATLAGTTPTYGSQIQNGTFSPNTASPRGHSVAFNSDNKLIDAVAQNASGNPAAFVSTNADLGSSWSTGMGTIHEMEAVANTGHTVKVVPLGSNSLLFWDNAGAGDPSSMTNVRWAKWTSSWSAIANVFTAFTACNPNQWCVARRDDTHVDVIVATGTNTFTHKVVNGTANTVGAGASIGTQGFLTTNGICAYSDGTSTWLFCILAASGNDIAVNKFDGSSWGGWSSLGLGSATRKYLSISPNADTASQIALLWTEGTGTPFNLVALPYVLAVASSAAGIAARGVHTAVGAATFAPGTKTAAGVAAGRARTTGASGAFTAPVYTAAGVAAASARTATGTATVAPGTKTAAAVTTASARAAVGAATVAPGTKTAAGAATASARVAAGAATFAAGTKTASAAGTSSAHTATVAATFTSGTTTAAGAAAASARSGASTAAVTAPVYTAAVVAASAAHPLAGTATHAPPAATSSVVATRAAATASGAALFAPPGAVVAAGTLAASARSAAGAAAFAPGTKTASAIASLTPRTTAAAATSTAPRYASTGTAVRAASSVQAAATRTTPTMTAQSVSSLAHRTAAALAVLTAPVYLATATATHPAPTVAGQALVTLPSSATVTASGALARAAYTARAAAGRGRLQLPGPLRLAVLSSRTSLLVAGGHTSLTVRPSRLRLEVEHGD